MLLGMFYCGGGYWFLVSFSTSFWARNHFLDFDFCSR